MKAKEAASRFLGKDGYKKVNCAQAFASVYNGKFNINDDLIKDFKKYGVGKAPEGECGIYFAGKHILKNSGSEDKVEEFSEHFNSVAGTFTCKELRKKKIPFCTHCLSESVLFVEDIVSGK